MQPQAESNNNSTKIILIVGGVGCLLLVICCVVIALLSGSFVQQVSDNLDDYANGDIEFTEETSPTPDGEAELGQLENPFKSTQQVTIEDIVWKVVSAEDVNGRINADRNYLDDCVANEGSKFIRVEFSVTNNTDDVLEVYDLEIADSEGRKFGEYADLYNCVSDYIIFEEINPELTKTFATYFEVPASKDASELMLVVSDLSFFSPKERYILLGL